MAAEYPPSCNPLFPFWGRLPDHPSQHRGLAPHPSTGSLAVGWGTLPDFSHRLQLGSGFSPDVDALTIIRCG